MPADADSSRSHQPVLLQHEVKLPLYRGESDVEAWIRKFNAANASNKYSKERLLGRLHEVFKGPAKDWYEIMIKIWTRS